MALCLCFFSLLDVVSLLVFVGCSVCLVKGNYKDSVYFPPSLYLSYSPPFLFLFSFVETKMKKNKVKPGRRREREK